MITTELIVWLSFDVDTKETCKGKVVFIMNQNKTYSNNMQGILAKELITKNSNQLNFTSVELFFAKVVSLPYLIAIIYVNRQLMVQACLLVC